MKDDKRSGGMFIESVLYGDQTQLAVTNMSFSKNILGGFPYYVKALAKVKKACAMANYQAGLLDKDIYERILVACDELIKGYHLGQFPVDVFGGGGGIAVNMNINEVIASIAGDGVKAIEHVNLSQSTSDVCHTALRVCLYERIGELEKIVKDTLDILYAKYEEFKPYKTIARTCWQDGIQVSAGVLFSATASVLKREHKNLLRYRDYFKIINLGWTVIGSGMNATDEYQDRILDCLSSVVGYECTWHEYPFEAAQYPDDLVRVSNIFRSISELMTKLARDIRILSSGPEAGLNELKLPNVQSGSSFFPGKNNPIIPETLIQSSLLVAGNDSIIQTCLGLGEVHLNVWENMMGFLLLQNISMIKSVLTIFNEKCLAGIELNKAVCEGYANSTMPLLVYYKEKRGYEYISKLVKDNGVSGTLELLKNKDLKEMG